MDHGKRIYHQNYTQPHVAIAHSWKHTPLANKPIPISERVECASILCACLLTTSGSVDPAIPQQQGFV